jgi:HAD superfamily hydrolase (TIGR01509 family)
MLRLAEPQHPLDRDTLGAMAMSARERVVCFDLGGVLVQIVRNWAEGCRRAGLSAPDAEWVASEAFRARRRDVVDRYQAGAVDCATYYAELARAVDDLYTVAELEAIHRAWTLEHYPGALDLVRELNAAPRVVTACLSNTNHAHWVRLVGDDGRGEYPAVAELRHRLASHLLGCLKPERRIFELARAKFSERAEVAPADIYFFDDLPENVGAARAAGWNAFQVDPAGDTVRQMRGILKDAGILR